MRFRFGTLFLFITVLGVFCAVVFAAPLALTALVLATTMLLSPAVWVAGSSYAHGGRAAFFRGGLICGILPYLVVCVYMVMALGNSFESWPDLGEGEDERAIRIALAAAWLAPGIFSFLGGAVSYVTYRLLSPPVAGQQDFDLPAADPILVPAEEAGDLYHRVTPRVAK